MQEGDPVDINKLNPANKIPINYTPKKNPVDNTPKKKARTDTFSISQEAQEYLARQKKQDGKKLPEISGEDKNTSFLEMEAFRKQQEKSNENHKNSIADMQKCMKIAARIMHGDKVPMKDRKFLAEKYPELYKNALLFQRHNPEPKKYKSITDDEDEKNGIDSVSSAESADSITQSAIIDSLENAGE